MHRFDRVVRLLQTTGAALAIEFDGFDLSPGSKHDLDIFMAMFGYGCRVRSYLDAARRRTVW